MLSTTKNTFYVKFIFENKWISQNRHKYLTLGRWKSMVEKFQDGGNTVYYEIYLIVILRGTMKKSEDLF